MTDGGATDGAATSTRPALTPPDQPVSTRPLDAGERRPLSSNTAMNLAVAVWLGYEFLYLVLVAKTLAFVWGLPTTPQGVLIANVLSGLVFLLPVLIAAPVMRYIGLRARDGFWLLVPLVSWIFALLLVRRLVFLPYRDWPARPGDRLAWETIQIRGLPRPIHKLAPRTPFDTPPPAAEILSNGR